MKRNPIGGIGFLRGWSECERENVLEVTITANPNSLISITGVC